MLSAFHEATGSNKPIEAIPLHSFYFSLQMRTGCLLMRNTPSKFSDLVLQTRVLVPLLLDEHDHPLKGRRWVLLIDRMLVYSAQLGRAFGRLIVFLFAHGQEIVFQSGFFELQGRDLASDAVEESGVGFVGTDTFYLQFLLYCIVILGEFDSLQRCLAFLDIPLQLADLLLKRINQRHKLLNLDLPFPSALLGLLPHILQVLPPFLQHSRDGLMNLCEFHGISMDELLLQFDEPAEESVLALHPSVLCLQVVHLALEEFGKAAVFLLEHGHFLFQWKSYSIIDRSILDYCSRKIRNVKIIHFMVSVKSLDAISYSPYLSILTSPTQNSFWLLLQNAHTTLFINLQNLT